MLGERIHHARLAAGLTLEALGQVISDAGDGGEKARLMRLLRQE